MTVATEVEFRRAIRDALDEELDRDSSVIFFGEDVAAAGGVFAVTPELAERYPDRVFDTAISELALASAAFGSAVSGLRPVIEIMFGDFLPLAMDSLVNQAAKYWFISGEQSSVPLVVRSAVGGGGRFGAIHSQVPAAWFDSVPGLKIVAPSSPADAKALLKGAIRDDNPVLFLEHKRLYSMKGPLEGEEVIAPGQAAIVRPGSDLTIVSAMRGVHDSIAAAEILASQGIDAEVIDLRTIRPIDWPTIHESLNRTNRLLVVEEGPTSGGWAGEVLARATEDALESIDDAWRMATPDHPIPYSPSLEDAFFPSAEAIAESVGERLQAMRLGVLPQHVVNAADRRPVADP
jgi:acetoin:2,6-dichlorophenolindophenol oxidoreductase subunit beta